MSSQIKPIKVWGKGGPNPPKVAMILEELGVPYDAIHFPLSDVKSPGYVAINPNGRLPSIQDPNTNITLWESGAIIEYLIEVYDKDYKLSFAPGTPEYFHAKQWLFFQTTGQGPYYGQAVWFKKFHSEQLPSVIERYNKEINRVTSVLDGYLAEQRKKYGDNDGSDGPWLVGNKISYADIVFVSYQRIMSMVLEKDQYDLDNFPYVKEWLAKMVSRKAVKIVLESTQELK